MEINVKDSILKLTQIEKNSLQKVINDVYYIMNDGLDELNHSFDNDITFDLDIGKLTLQISEDEVTYHFEPSSQLENVVSKALVDKENLLTESLTKKLKSQVLEIYKDLL